MKSIWTRRLRGMLLLVLIPTIGVGAETEPPAVLQNVRAQSVNGRFVVRSARVPVYLAQTEQPANAGQRAESAAAPEVGGVNAAKTEASPRLPPAPVYRDPDLAVRAQRIIWRPDASKGASQTQVSMPREQPARAAPVPARVRAPSIATRALTTSRSVNVAQAAESYPASMDAVLPVAALPSPADLTTAPALQVSRAEQAERTPKAMLSEFSVLEGQTLSEALRGYVARHRMRLQWNARTDKVIDHPYMVKGRTFEDVLEAVIRPYGYSANIWDGNAVVEIYVAQGEQK